MRQQHEIGRRSAAVLALVILTIAAAWAVTSARAETALGPHRATAAVTLRGDVVIDLGPLGAIFLDSPYPPMGVELQVHEIPISALGESLLTGLKEDAQSYVVALSQPRAAVMHVADDLIANALGRFALVSAVGLTALGLARWRRLKVSRLQLVAAPAAASAALVLLALPQWTTARPETETVSVLNSTPYASVRVSGRLGEVINTYAPELLQEVEDTQEFYNALQNQMDSFARAAAVASPRSGWDLADEPASSSVVTILFTTDLHCNISMAPVVEELARAAGADLILNGGDTVMSGTSVEDFCVDTFARAWSIPVVVADGNHDSVLTAQQEESRGWQVLHGDIVEVQGLTILGDTDPTLTEVGSGTRQERDETITEMGDRLAETACDGGGVDILLVHNPRAAQAALDAGCATLALSGHLHRTIEPEVSGQGVRYVGSSSGGGNDGGRTIGTLQTTADFTVLKLVDGVPWRYSIVTAHPDDTVTVGTWQDFPSAEGVEQ